MLVLILETLRPEQNGNLSHPIFKYCIGYIMAVFNPQKPLSVSLLKRTRIIFAHIMINGHSVNECICVCQSRKGQIIVAMLPFDSIIPQLGFSIPNVHIKQFLEFKES